VGEEGEGADSPGGAPRAVGSDVNRSENVIVEIDSECMPSSKRLGARNTAFCLLLLSSSLLYSET